MNIEGIPLKRPVYIVVTAASHVADPVEIAPVLKQGHQTGDTAFHVAFIQNVGAG